MQHEPEHEHEPVALVTPISPDGNRIHRRRRPTLRNDACGCNQMGCGRLYAFFSCILLLIIIAILLAFFFWARVPEVKVLGVDQGDGKGNPVVQLRGDGFILRVRVNLEINNSNYIGGHFDSFDGQVWVIS